jgi:glucose-1-phosphate thymidylyltransferase
MKIFIPMAGKGTRLRPFTLSTPKPLIKIIDKPIVEHLIDQITSTVKVQIKEIIYILGDENYFNSEVVDSLKDISKKYNANTKVYRQLEQKGTGHAIMCAKESLKGPAVIAYADTMIQGDIEIDPNIDGSIWVKKVINPEAYGVVKLDSQSKIIELVEKPLNFITDLAVVGIYYFKEIEILRDYLEIHLQEKLPHGQEYLLNYGIEKMIENNYTFIPKEIEKWMDCGTPKLLLESAKTIMDSSSIYDKTIHDDVTIVEPVFLGKNTKIRNSVIGPYVSIGRGCQIENSTLKNTLLYDNVKVINSKLEDSIVGSNSEYEGEGSEVYLGDNTKM